MKKRLFLLVTILSLTLLITGCGKEKEEKSSDKKYDYLVLVNKYSQLPDDWEKNVELVKAKNAWDEEIEVEKEAYEQYKKLVKELNKDLEKDKTTVELDSTYRSVKDQQQLWDEWSKDPTKGIEYVKKFVAVPGYSEHHTGLAIDICIKKDGNLIYDNDEMIAEKKIFAKIHKKLAKYGFILRYLEGRDDVTGYAYEPWHLRYVGSSEIAKEIMDKNITFEEYLDTRENLEEVPSALKYRIEKSLQEYFKEYYKGKISNSRFNITKIYTEKDSKEEPVKSLKLGKNEYAFEVTYQVEPAKEIDPNTLTIPNGEYDKKLGWVKDIKRVGVLKYNEKKDKYYIDKLESGW